MKKLVVALGILALTGCVALQPTKEQWDEADKKGLHGPVPNAKAMVDGYLHATLKDPYSVRDLAIGQLEKSAILGRHDVWGNSDFTYCYRCVVQYNAKNGFGAYVGLRTYLFYLRADSGILLIEG